MALNNEHRLERNIKTALYLQTMTSDTHQRKGNGIDTCASPDLASNG